MSLIVPVMIRLDEFRQWPVCFEIEKGQKNRLKMLCLPFIYLS